MNSHQPQSTSDQPLVGVLVRVSTKKQGERGASIETQKCDCAAYSERQGWKVALVEEDHESGTDFDREGYQRLLAAAKEGRIQGVVVRDLSRFGRGDFGSTAREFEEFRVAGCFIGSALDGVILQPTEHLAKRLDVGIKVLVNGYYSAMLSENVPPNMERRVREGKWVSSAPFGYRVVEAPDGRGRTLEPDPETAWAVPEIFRMAADGQSEAAIMALVRKHGLSARRNRSAQTLSRTTIRHMLESAAYIGKVVWNREGRGKFRSRGRRPDDEVVVADGLHPPLVDAEIFQRVQARLEQRRTFKTYTKRNVSLLDGIVYCGRCGAKMRLASNTMKGRTYLYYSCANKHDRYSCDQPLVSAQRVDEQVLAVIHQTFEVANVTAEAAREVLVKRREKLVTDTASLRARLERRQVELRGKLDRLLDEAVSQDVSEPRRESIERVMKGHERDLEAVEQELHSLRPEEDQLREVDDAIGWLESFERAEHIFERMGKEKGVMTMRKQIVKTAKRADAYDATAWQRIARQFIHRAEIEGRLKDGQVTLEWSGTGQSILREQSRILQLARTVFRRCAVPQSRR